VYIVQRREPGGQVETVAVAQRYVEFLAYVSHMFGTNGRISSVSAFLDRAPEGFDPHAHDQCRVSNVG
jgi:hypothetical protein